MKPVDKTARARKALKDATIAVRDALDDGDLPRALNRLVLGCYYQGHLHAYEDRPLPTDGHDVDDDAFGHQLNRALRFATKMLKTR